MFVADATVLFGYEAIIEFISLLVTAGIALYAYKIYKYSSEKRYLYFAMAFASISAAFLINSFINAEVFFSRVGSVSILDIPLTTSVLTLYKAAYITQLFLMLSGYMFLTILTFKLEDKRPLPLFLFFTVISTILGYKWSIAYYITSFVLLSYIVYYYYENYLKKKSAKTLLVFASFKIITLAQVLFILALFFKQFYFIGDIAELVGYIVLLTGLVLVLRK
ncbi:MAG TPA: hypothetical protein VJB94_04945 [Candidatus Nanoarchaeia archaeon]|nr:hypothetical protein [Candidatus Nanoarchaeia archaeon]